MIWLLTRVIISSTVCPEGAAAAAAGADAGAAAGFAVFVVEGKGASACPTAREGRDIKATRMRECFFIGCVGPPRVPACGQGVGSDRRDILLLRREPGGAASSFDAGVGWKVGCGLEESAGLVGANQGQSGAIVA